MTDEERLKLLRKAFSRLEETQEGFTQARKDINRHGHWKAAMLDLHALEDDLASQPAPPDKERLKLLREALTRLERTGRGYKQAIKDINRHGNWKASIQVLHALADELTPQPAPTSPTAKMPDLGPVFPGGKSLLDECPTHDTSRLSGYPGFDTNFRAGSSVIAPEGGMVTRHSGSDRSGFSVYMTGDSGLKYYFQHMNPDGRAPRGRIEKGEKIGTVGSAKRFPGMRVDHNHVGVNCEAFLGKGKELLWGGAPVKPRKRYGIGSATIRKQLKGS
jgi:murein DD-endopeptidase MepM/ murein hydrolase activator NlpD